MYCSREGLPDSQRRRGSGGSGGGGNDHDKTSNNENPAPKRRRVSKRCDCRWRVVLSETTPGCWRFRRSLNPSASEHNHAMMSPDEIVVQHWPSAMNSLIVELARDRVPTHDIRTRVQQAYPDIVWNERRFYNRLTEERKRIRSRDILDRSRRLLLLLSRLTSLAAANEHWAAHVESEMARLFDNFCQAAHPHVDPDMLVVNLDPDQICHDKQQQQQQQQESTRKRKASNNSSISSSSKELKIHIPSYTLAVTPQKFRQPSSASPSSILCNSHMASASTIVTGATHSPSSSSLCPSEYAYNDNASSNNHQQSMAASFLSPSPAETVTQTLPFDFSSGMVLPKQPDSMFLDYGLLQQQHHHHQQQHLQRLDDPLPQGPW